ncbi:MAG: glutathione S-transferase [Gammaproteobacteria bacterium]|jgi:glutathione S-transferase
MKIYNSLGPNPRAVRMILMEKGLSFPMERIDLLAAENRSGDYAARNPGAQLPSLETDQGVMISETVPIFEYLEDKHPTPPMIGRSAEEKAECRMWTRRVELKITEHVYCGFRYGPGLEVYQQRQPVFPEMLEGLKAQVDVGLQWLDPLLVGKNYLCGDRFTMADVVLFVALDFGQGIQIPTGLPEHVQGWFEKVNGRPSAVASLDAQGVDAGFRGA